MKLRNHLNLALGLYTDHFNETQFNHIIIVGWNSRTKEVITFLRDHQPDACIVLIDKTLRKAPFSFKMFKFIHADPTLDTVLEDANIKESDLVIITADQYANERSADIKSVITTLAVKGNNPEAYTIVEILSKEQVENAKRSGADEVIFSSEMKSNFMMMSILNKGISKDIIPLLSLEEKQEFDYFPIAEDFHKKTLIDCITQMTDHQVLPIGLKRGKDIFIYPSHSSEQLQPDDLLVVIKSNENKEA